MQTPPPNLSIERTRNGAGEAVRSGHIERAVEVRSCRTLGITWLV